MQPLFDPSMMTYFRKCFTAEDIAAINEELYRRMHPPKDEPPRGGGNRGMRLARHGEAACHIAEGHPVKFGQKLAFSVVEGFTFIDEQSFDSFNKGVTLMASAQKYRARVDCWPEAIGADTIYRNRKNRRFYKEHSIRLSGPRLGRPKAAELEIDREQAYRDRCQRNVVESRNGIAKRRYGRDRILPYLADTATAEAALIVLVMNAAHCLRALLRLLLEHLFTRVQRRFPMPDSISAVVQ